MENPIFRAIDRASAEFDWRDVRDMVANTDPNVRNSEGMSLLNYLLKKHGPVGIPIHFPGMVRGPNIFHEIIDIVLDRGADVNYGHSIEYAIDMGDPAILRKLFAKGAMIDDWYLQYAAHFECEDSRSYDNVIKEMLEILIENGANVKHVDEEGRTAFDFYCGKSKEIIKLLLTSQQTTEQLLEKFRLAGFNQTEIQELLKAHAWMRRGHGVKAWVQANPPLNNNYFGGARSRRRHRRRTLSKKRKTMQRRRK